MSKSRENTVAKQSTPVEETQKSIIVLGMHRSGTSAMARIMNLLGVALGEDIVPPQFDNPRGFLEHRKIYEIHDKLLSGLGSAYDDIRPLPQNWWTTDTKETNPCKIRTSRQTGKIKRSHSNR